MLLEDNLSPWRLEELIGFTELLLDFAELLLDLAFELEELFTTEEELLDFTEFDDALVSFSSFDEDDFAFSLLDEFFCTLELEDFAELLLDSSAFGFRMTDEDDSTPNSSFGPEEDESSPHPTNANVAKKSTNI